MTLKDKVSATVALLVSAAACAAANAAAPATITIPGERHEHAVDEQDLGDANW